MKKFEITVAMEPEFVEGFFLSRINFEKELRVALRTCGMVISGRIFTTPGIAEVNPYTQKDAPFIRRFAITDPKDFPKFALAMILLGSGNWMSSSSLIGRKISADMLKSVGYHCINLQHPVDKKNDPFTIELKLNSEVGS